MKPSYKKGSSHVVEADTGYFLKTPSSALFLLKNDTDHVIYPQLSKLIMPKNS